MAQNFNIGGFVLHSYGLIVAFALLLGMGVAYFLANKDDEYRIHLLDVVFYGFIGAIIGARIWQVLFYDWSYYSQNLLESIMIWKGGLAVQGGIVGAIIVGFLYSKYKKINFWRLADIASPGLIFGQAIGRIACFLNGDAFGRPTGSDFGLVYPPGTSAYATYGSQPLWPAEVWEGQINFVIFAIIVMISRAKNIPQGLVFLTYAILYAANRFFMEFFRGDGSKFLFDLTAGQWTSIGMIVFSVVLGSYLLTKTKRNVSEQIKQ